MSGGYFDYQEYVLGDIARSIEHVILIIAIGAI